MSDHVPQEAIAEARRAINDGNEDLIGLTMIAVMQCESRTPEKWYRPDGGMCPRKAVYQTTDGQRLCTTHAEIWAAKNATQGATPSTPATGERA